MKNLADSIDDASSHPVIASTIRKVVLHLVTGGPERAAIERGQADAILDPASGIAIVLPQAQRALIERRSMAGLAFDWSWEQDEHGRFTSHAGAGGRPVALGSTAILGRALWELATEPAGATDWQTHRQQLQWQAPFRDFELRHRDDDGRERLLAFSGEPVFDAADRFTGYRGVARDITAQRQLEAAQRAANGNARTALDALAVPICLLDAAGTVLLTNRAWIADAAILAGAWADTRPGVDLLECLQSGGAGADDGAALAAGLRQVLAGEQPSLRYEQAWQPAPGAAGRRWIRIGFDHEAGGLPGHVVVTLEDITAVTVEAAGRELELAVAGVLAAAGDAAAGLTATIRIVCAAQGWDCGRYFHLDAAAGTLHLDASWGVPTAATGRFLERSQGMVCAADAGLAGRVLQSGQALWRNGGGDGDLAELALAPETSAEDACLLPVVAPDATLGLLALTGAAGRAGARPMPRTAHAIGRQLGQFLRSQAALADLQRSASRLRKLIELSCDWYWEQDSALRFTQSVGGAVFGGDAVLGRTLRELPHLELASSRWDEHQAQLAARWSFCDFELGVRLPDGQLCHYGISGEPLYDAAGAFCGYCGTGVELDRRRHRMGAT